MKKCPTCNRTYTDDGLSFCLEDGVPLLNVAASDPGLGGANFDPNMTLQFEDPRDTSPPPTLMITPDQMPSLADLVSTPAYQTPTPVAPPPPPTPTIGVQGLTQPEPEPAWQPPSVTPVSTAPPLATPQTQPPKKSMMPWLIGGGLLLALLGIGIVGVIIFAAMSDNSNTKTENSNAKSGDDKKTTNTNTGEDKPPVKPDDSEGAFKDDFSESKWPTGQTGLGSSYKDGMYIMQHTPADQFIANYAPDGSTGYITNGAKSVSITTQALDEDPPEYGYGLVLHGGITNGNKLNGYAFLVDTGNKPQISIAELRNSSLTYLVKPKSGSMVLTGDAENRLTVKIDGKKLDFYVNDQLAASITDKDDLQGRVGFFTSTGGQVGFDNLEISK